MKKNYAITRKVGLGYEAIKNSRFIQKELFNDSALSDLHERIIYANKNGDSLYFLTYRKNQFIVICNFKKYENIKMSEIGFKKSRNIFMSKRKSYQEINYKDITLNSRLEMLESQRINLMIIDKPVADTLSKNCRWFILPVGQTKLGIINDYEQYDLLLKTAKKIIFKEVFFVKNNGKFLILIIASSSKVNNIGSFNKVLKNDL